jgi:iron complex outermembrane receptor protein
MRVYYQHVEHYMDFGPNRLHLYNVLTGTDGKSYPVVNMPMYTRSDTVGATGKAEFALSTIDNLRVGYDLQFYRLKDWWPPSPDCGVGICAGGMAPYTFLNINNGHRDRYAGFVEWERAWSPAVTTLLGARYERIEANTGAVQGYTTTTTPAATMMQRMMYASSSVGTLAAFNAMNRARGFDNVDLSALLRYAPNANVEAELGFAQTMRAPNLYELYAWSPAAMPAVMNNFVGDGNGYVGNPNLKAEQAHKVSASLAWRSDDRETEIRLSPYYSHVNNYIDAVRLTANGPGAFNILQYANKEAELYGVDLSARAPLARTAYGDFAVNGMLSYTRGRDVALHTGLYNIMPLNGRVAVTHMLGGWRGAAELVAVADKTDVSAPRNEIRTPGYGLFNLRGAYAWNRLQFNFGVENVLNRLYFLPLGGTYVGEGRTMSLNGVSWGTAVPGPGRTFYAGVRVEF